MKMKTLNKYLTFPGSITFSALLIVDMSVTIEPLVVKALAPGSLVITVLQIHEMKFQIILRDQCLEQVSSVYITQSETQSLSNFMLSVKQNIAETGTHASNRIAYIMY